MIDIESEPDGDSLAPHHFYIGVFLSIFAFASIWPYYSVTGASLTVIGLLIALDDVIEHTTRFSTPLDQIWKRLILPIIRRFEK